MVWVRAWLRPTLPTLVLWYSGQHSWVVVLPQQHSGPQRKFWVEQVPPPPPWGRTMWGRTRAIKQRIQSSHMPTCHRHMVFATNFSSMFDLLLCSTSQTWAECCLELTAVSGYQMFLGPFG